MWDLLHAWREWLAGHDTTQLRVFGVAVLWWGRLGKTLEFLGGLTVVIDLLGRARMEAFHATLRGRRARLVGRLRETRSRLVARLRGAPRREAPARSTPVRPPGLRACHRAGTVAAAVFLLLRYFGNAHDPMPTPVFVVLSFALVAPLAGVALGELAYLIGLLLLEALAAAVSGKRATSGDKKSFQAVLKHNHAQLRARWRGARTPGAPPPPPKTTAASPDPPGLRAFLIGGIVAVGLFLFVTEHYVDAPPNDPMPLPLLIAVTATVVGGLLGGGGYLLAILLLEAFVVTTLGQLKSREGLESRLKWFGLAIFVVGFSMDLLSS